MRRCNKKKSEYNDTTVFIWYWNDFNNTELEINSWRKSPIDSKFNPNVFIIENVKTYYESGSFSEMSPIFKEQKSKLTVTGREDLGIYGMTYAIMMSNKMREDYEKRNNMKFDCVMRARFELKFLGPGSTNYDPNAIFRVENYDLNKLWISHTNTNIRDGMCDCIAFSNSETMSHYSTVYNRLNELSEIEEHNPEIIFHHNTKHLIRSSQYVLVGF